MATWCPSTSTMANNFQSQHSTGEFYMTPSIRKVEQESRSDKNLHYYVHMFRCCHCWYQQSPSNLSSSLHDSLSSTGWSSSTHHVRSSRHRRRLHVCVQGGRPRKCFLWSSRFTSHGPSHLNIILLKMNFILRLTLSHEQRIYLDITTNFYNLPTFSAIIFANNFNICGELLLLQSLGGKILRMYRKY